MQRELQRNNIVLLGAGHTNAHVLRMWRMEPIPGAELICVNDFPVATYSGMLPGVLAGQYRREEMEIDLVRFCSVSDIRLIVARVEAIDVAAQMIRFSDRPPLRFDWLSIGIGSQPETDGVEIAGEAPLIRIKPMQTFLDRLQSLIRSLKVRTDPPLRFRVVGAGAGGLEVAMCLSQRLRRELPGPFEMSIVSGSWPGKGLLPSTVRRVRRELDDAGIAVYENSQVTRIEKGRLILANGTSMESDVVIWATGAVAKPLLQESGLPADAGGFLRTRATLQSIGHDRIFVVGDSGSIEGSPVDKAGVFAVRQGPILWDNLRSAIAGRELREYVPQRGYLKLLNCGNGRAIAEYKGFSFAGKWCWRLKNYIDRGFMAMHQEYHPMPQPRIATNPAPAPEMRCLGCGGKIGGSALRRALEAIAPPASAQVILGLGESDDAAIIRTTDNQVTVTTDFFAAPIRDPFTMGRIAALHAVSDVYAMNAQPVAALSIVQVPAGYPRAQEDMLAELMAGAQQELEKCGATIAGGHTIEGTQLVAGFTILASQRKPITTKGGLKPGDVLILTREVGTGILLAGLMRGKCRSEWYEPLIQNMLAGNRIALELADQFEIRGMTDVTGFGLGGHLREMVDASRVSARIFADRIPVLPGVRELLNEGIESTLAPDNEIQAGIRNGGTSWTGIARVVFDPQTSGGILFGVPAGLANGAMDFLKSAGCNSASPIGEVGESAGEGAFEITLVNQ